MQTALTDKNHYPTDEIIFSHLKRSKSLWDSIFQYIHKEHPQLTEQWRYYNDGKSWLMKVSNKSKTTCWVSVGENAFRMTFYFTVKAESALLHSSISDNLKDQFLVAKRFKKIQGITVLFKKKKDVQYAKELLEIKLSLN